MATGRSDIEYIIIETKCSVCSVLVVVAVAVIVVVLLYFCCYRIF